MRKTDVVIGHTLIKITKDQIDKLLNKKVLRIESHLYRPTHTEDNDYVEDEISYIQTEKDFILTSVVLEGVLDDIR